MTELDDCIRPVALSLLQEFGKPVTFTVTSGGTYDRSTGGVTGSSTEDFTWEISPPQPFNERLVDGDLVQRGDLQTFIADKDIPFTVDTGIKIDIDGEKWEIVSFMKLYSGVLIAAYELQLRR